MTRKVIDISEGGRRFVCQYTDKVKYNPYRLYELTYDRGWHRKQIAKYADFYSVLWHLVDMGRDIKGWIR